MFSRESLVYAWDNGGRYAEALLEDVTDEQMVLRPGEPDNPHRMNHPAWILGHMSLYYPIVPALLAGEAFDDPADHDLFGFRGRGPQDDVSLYGTKESQLERLSTGHEQVAQALLTASEDQLNRRPSLPRWAEMYPTVEFMLPDLLLMHENIHIGQISIWRRAAGLPSVPFPDRTPRTGLVEARGG
ncbi:MAG: DinB family protein [Lacipirellulaceae bacterium]